MEARCVVEGEAGRAEVMMAGCLEWAWVGGCRTIISVDTVSRLIARTPQRIFADCIHLINYAGRLRCCVLWCFVELFCLLICITCVVRYGISENWNERTLVWPAGQSEMRSRATARVGGTVFRGRRGRRHFRNLISRSNERFGFTRKK